MKKILSLFLAVFMVLSIAAAPASALSDRSQLYPTEDMSADFTITADKTSVEAGEQVYVTMNVTGSYTFHTMIVGVTYETGSFTYIAMNEEEEPGDPAVGGEDPYFEYGTVATKLPTNAMKTASYVAGSDGRDKLNFGAVLPTTGRSTTGDIGSFIFVALEDAEIGDHTFEIVVTSFDYAPQGETAVAIPYTTSIPSVTVAVEGEVPPTPEYTVTFVDGVDNATLGTMTVEEGYELTERDFPTPPEHDGYNFISWSAEAGTAITADTTVTAQYEAISTDPTLDEALNVPGGTLHFTSEGTYPWVVVNDGTRVYAKSSNEGQGSTESVLTLEVSLSTSKTLSFDFNAMGEGTSSIWDKCIFAIDGTAQFTYGARNSENQWEAYTAIIAAGDHTLTWTFSKDSSVNATGDHFAVDNVALEDVEDITITFVEDVNNTEIDTMTVTPPYTLAGDDFPTPPEIEGYTFIRWNAAAGDEFITDATITAHYQSDKLLIWDFETDPIAQGFLIENHGQGNTWVWIQNSNNSGNNTHYEGEGFMRVTYSSNQNDAWLITPNFKGDSISFWTNNYGSYPETMNVLVSTDNGANWTQVATYTVSNNTPQQLTVNLGDYTGQTIRVAFQNVSTNQWYQMLDYITVENGELVEVACTVTFVDSITEDVIGTIQVSAGSTLAETDFPTVPAHEGYTFTGWDYVDGTVINTDTTVTAVYEADVTITFVDGTDNTVLGTMTKPYGYVMTERDYPTPPEHAGLAFSGWSVVAGTAITADTTIIANYIDPNSTIWDFETDPTAQGFQMLDQDGDGYNWDWELLTTVPDEPRYHEGLGYMTSASYINNVGALTPDNWLVTPQFNGAALTFWACGQDPSYAAEYIGAFVSTDGGETWSEEIVSWTLTGTDTQYTVPLTDYLRDNVKVAIRHYNVTDMFYANLDYMEVVPAAEEKIVVTFVDGLDGSTIGTIEVDQGYVLTDADFPAAPEHEDYEFTGWDYSGDAVVSNLTVTAQYKSTKTIIWDFNIASGDPENIGFQYEDKDGSGSTWAWLNGSSNTSYCYEGDGCMYINYQTEPSDWLITPPFTALDNCTISFWMRGYSSSYTELVNVLVSTDGGETWSDPLMQASSNSTTYAQFTADLSEYAGQEIMVAFEYCSDDTYYCFLDYIEVSDAVQAELPPKTVSFVDTLTGETISELVVEHGYVLTEEDFPTVEHAGYDLYEWDYNGFAITADTTIPAIFVLTGSTVWDFNSNNDPNEQGFTMVDADGDGNNWIWQAGTDYASMRHYEGDGLMTSASYSGSALTPDNYLITPEFEGGTKISFWIVGQDPSYAAETMGVYVTLDNGETWSDELLYVTATGENVQYEVDLSDYADQNIKVGFRHYNVTDMFRLNLDFVVVDPAAQAPEAHTLYIDIDSHVNVTVYLADAEGWGTVLNHGDEIYDGDELNIIAVAEPGYVLTDDPTGVITVNNDFTVYARTELATYALTLGVNDPDAAALPGTRIDDLDAIEFGTEVTVVAADPNSGYKFTGWTEAGNTKVVCLEKEYTFTMTSNLNLVANYQSTEGHTVTWMAYNRVIKTMTDVTEITAEDYPEAPTPMPGFVFEGWNRNANYVNRLLKKGNVTVKAKFAAAPAETAIVLTVYNGESETAVTFEYNESTWVEITADEVEGKSFAYWTLNDTLLTYNKVAQFRITEDATLKAFYTEETEGGSAILRTANFYAAAHALTFAAEVTIPEGATVVAAGLLAKAGAVEGELSERDADFHGESEDGSHVSWTKTNVNIGDAWTVRPYVTYDLNGSFVEVFGNTVVVTAGTDYDVAELGTAVITSYQYLADVAKAQFIAFLTVPEEGTIVKAGLVAAEQGYNGIDFNETVLTAENAHFVKNHQLAVGTNGPVNYTWTKTNVQPGDVWFARAYLVYNLYGEEHVVYGDIVMLIAE